VAAERGGARTGKGCRAGARAKMALRWAWMQGGRGLMRAAVLRRSRRAELSWEEGGQLEEGSRALSGKSCQ